MTRMLLIAVLTTAATTGPGGARTAGVRPDAPPAQTRADRPARPARLPRVADDGSPVIDGAMWSGPARLRLPEDAHPRFNAPGYVAPAGWSNGYRRFTVGMSLGRALYDRRYRVDPRAYRLPAASASYRWVRHYDDALLVDLRTGRVVDTAYDLFGG